MRQCRAAGELAAARGALVTKLQPLEDRGSGMRLTLHNASPSAASTSNFADAGLRAACLFTLSSADVHELRQAFVSIVRKLEAFATTLAPSPKRAAQRLRVPGHLTAYLPRSYSPDATFFGRLDFVLSYGHPYLIEVNFGTPAGASIDAEAYGESLLPSDGVAFRPNSARMAWLAEQCRSMGFKDANLPVWPWRHFTDPASYFAPSRRIFEEHGVHLRLIGLDELLSLPRPAPDPNLRLFSTIDAHRHGYSASDLGMGAIPTINWLYDDSSLIASSKQLLASKQFLLSLSPVERRALAATRVLESDNAADHEVLAEAQAIKDREHLVLKPCHDQGGNGVIVGKSRTDREWSAALANVDSPVVLQRFYEPDLIEYAARNLVTGETTRRIGVGSYGAYFLGDTLVGLLARIAPADVGAAQPVNGHTGALVTAIAVSVI